MIGFAIASDYDIMSDMPDISVSCPDRYSEGPVSICLCGENVPLLVQKYLRSIVRKGDCPIVAEALTTQMDRLARQERTLVEQI